MTENTPNHEDLIEDEARRWIARMASAEMTADELAAFKAWRVADPSHNRAFEQQRELWRAVGERPSVAANPRRARFTPRRNPRRPLARPARRLPRPLAASGIAAALVGAMIFGPDVVLMARADHRTGITIESVSLPDGSRAMLDADSAISIAYTDDTRRIEVLRGHAWFEVAHADPRPFRVAALGGMTQDIGTAFEVRREPDEVGIAVTHGAVRVHAPEDGEGLLLRASQRASYGKGGPAVRLDAAEPANIAPWRQGEILFDNATIADAVQEIARYRSAPVFILGTPAGERRISGVFRTDRPDEAIGAVARMGGLIPYHLGGITVLRPRD